MASTASPTVTVALSDAFEVFFQDDINRTHARRMSFYRQCWLYYLGKHWSYARDPGDPVITMNYARKIVDLHSDFTFSKGFDVVIPDNPETTVNEKEERDFVRIALEETWRKNNKSLWCLEAGQQGGITGDVFARVSWEMSDPLEDPYARVDIIPSHLVFPEFGGPFGVDRKKVTRAIVITPTYRDKPEAKGPFIHRNLSSMTSVDMIMKVEEWISAKIDPMGNILEPAKIRYYENKDFIKEVINPLGEIPIVHIPNYPLTGEYYGMSDLVDIMDLNRELNEKATDISDIINYHACVDEKTEALTRSGWKKPVMGDEIMCLHPETDEISWEPIAVLNEYDYDGELVSWKNHVDALTTSNHRWLVERKSGRKPRYIRKMSFTSDVVNMAKGSRIVLGGGIPTQFPEEKTHDDELVGLVGWFVTEGALDPLPSGSVVSFIHQSERANPEYVARIRRLARYWRGRGHTFTEQTPRPDGVIGWYLGTDLTALLLEISPCKQLTPKFLSSLTHLQAEMLLDILMAADGTGTKTWYQDDLSRRDGFQMLCSMLGKRSRSYENIRGNGIVDIYEKRATLVEHTAPTNEHYVGKVWCPTVSTGVWLARRNGSTYWTGNSPQTVIYGAKLKDLEKGANRTWALPEGAKVENLELKGDLAAASAHWNMLKTAVLELSNTPESILGAQKTVTSPSGVSLQMQYLPMIQKRDVKVQVYGMGLRLINRLILKYIELTDPAFSSKFKALSGNRYRNEVVFPDPLPQDERRNLEISREKLALGLSTRCLELESMGYSEAEAEKIIEEAREDLSDDMEMGVQFDYVRKQGQTPNRGGSDETRGEKIDNNLSDKASGAKETKEPAENEPTDDSDE